MVRCMMRTLAAVALLASGACGEEAERDEQGHAHGDHGHGAEGPTVSITRWTERLELFAEHPAAVVGETVPFLAHLTDLSDFSPVTEGRVVLVLEGPQTIRAEHDRPLRPGIFSPRFIPRAPGTYRARLEVRTPDLEAAVGDMTVEVYPTAEAAAEAAAKADDAGGTISFLKEQQWQLPFQTAFAEERVIVPTVEVPGEITTPPGGRAAVGAPVAGRLVAPRSGLPRPGETVRAGQLLALVAPTPSSPEAGAHAGLAVAEASARLAAARSDLARAERLIADQAISARELEQARREAGVAEEAVAAAQRAEALYRGAASGRGAGTWRLTAPIGGIVTEVNASPGEPISADDVILRIVDPSELWIRARVPEQDAPHVRADADASYQLAGTDGWRPIDVTGDDAPASVVNVGQTVHPEARTVDVIYALEQADAASRIGALVRVAVPTGESARRVAVPRSAVVNREGRAVVYVQVEGESFDERTVHVGERAGEWIAIERGLDAGERVVTAGASFIRLAEGAPAGAGHGHVH